MLGTTPRGIGCHHFLDLATSPRSVTGHPIAIQVAWAPPVTIQTSRVNWCSTGDETKPCCKAHGYNCRLNCLFVSSFLPSFFHSLFAFPIFFPAASRPPKLPFSYLPSYLPTSYISMVCSFLPSFRIFHFSWLFVFWFLSRFSSLNVLRWKVGFTVQSTLFNQVDSRIAFKNPPWLSFLTRH